MNESELKKRDNESQNEYIARIYKNKVELNLTNNMCKDTINKELNTGYAESTLRSIAYPFTEGYELGFEKALSKREANEELQELEAKRLEIEKMKIQYQDQKREYNNYLRADARFEHLRETMKKEILRLNELKPLVVKDIPSIIGENHAVSICSDWHTGIKEKNYWNEISIDILRDRIEKLQNKIISICEKHEVSTLHTEILGDMINGLIHVTTRISNEEDVIKQTMICAEILADMVTNLARKIPSIKIYSTIGNHGRCVANAKESLDIENFERLVPWYLQARLVNIANIEFCGNVYDDGIIVYQFLNETIFAVHGHEDKVTTAVSDLSKMLKIFPTELHMGHYHSYYEKDDHDISTVVNGTASGVDKYAKGIRKTGRATQTCMVYTEEGRECTYKIKLN
jgi:uncharacterized protein YejL (UPF0352 family)